MNHIAHWTQGSIDDFAYAISSNFTAQLERKMEETEMTRSKLAAKIGKSSGRVSQVFNDPGNLSLRTTVEYARALGMKVSLIAYEDGDLTNANGPINPEVFVKCWKNANQPTDLFAVEDTKSEHPKKQPFEFFATVLKVFPSREPILEPIGYLPSNFILNQSHLEASNVFDYVTPRSFINQEHPPTIVGGFVSQNVPSREVA